MPGSSFQTFDDPDDYQARLRQSQIDLILICRGMFNARLTSVELGHLDLMRCQEENSHIAYLSFPPLRAFASFRTGPGPPPLLAGRQLQLGEVRFHSPGERLHSQITGPCSCSLIALSTADLEEFGRTLLGQELAPPATGRVLRPPLRDFACIQRLHAAACRLAETKPQTLAHREAARSLEQDLIPALLTCLVAVAADDDTDAERRRAGIMVRFEEVLTKHLRQPLRHTQLCELIGVTDGTLQSCCAEFLGVSATQYVLLRRLKEVRRALKYADSNTTSLAEILNDWSFAVTSRGFAKAYSEAFGEPPSATLHRLPKSQFLGPMSCNSVSD